LQVEVVQERFAGESRLPQSYVHGYICVPLWFGDHFEGALTAILKEGVSVNDPLVQALVGSSVHIAAALAQARLHSVVKGEQERLRAILDQLPEGILIVEAMNDTITYANAAAEQILGLPIQSLLGSPITSYRGIEIVSNTGTDLRLPWNFVITEALGGGTVRSREAILTRADGSKVTVLGSTAPLRSDSGMITGVLLVFQDITAQKSIEQHKKEFLSIASHELRTPITAIQGFAEILQMQASREQKLSPQGLRAITFINEQSQSLIRLIEEMLDITRVENAQLQLDIATHDLVSTIAHVIETQATTTPQHHLQFVLDGLPSPAKLMGKFDENRIVQVLNNLISNAVKYSSAGSNIEVGLRRCSGDADTALIWVKDSGIGISAHDLPHIFKRFHRANHIDPSINGLGIGLYLVQELVTSHGGRVWAESTEKSGSTFYVQLPLSIEQPAPQLN
jgi:PAS domain S-box-containing protein